MTESRTSIEISTVEQSSELVKTMKLVGVTHFKIGDIAMDLTGDSYPTAPGAPVEEETDDDVLFYSAT